MNLPASLPVLADSLRSGALPLPEYIAQLAARFAAREPDVQAFMPEPGRFERVLHAAQQLQASHPNPAARPALFGVAVGIKDIFHVDGFATTGGSRLPVEALRGAEAPGVTRLKNAGALVLGKTVSTEFAYFGPGATRNPHSPAGQPHTPGGSSSGSAAAVAAGLAPLTLGTQTIGSIVRPAAYCGVVGFKPSYDRIPRVGVIALAPSLDHVGVFAADVAGVQLAARLLANSWNMKPAVAHKPVFGIPEGPYLESATPKMLAYFHATAQKLADAGCVLKRVNMMQDFAALRERHYLITAAEAARVHAGWFAQYRDLYHFKTVELLERGAQITDAQLSQALASCGALRTELAQVMEREQIDVWLSPAAQGPAPAGLDSTGDPVMNLPWTHAGLPAVGLPSGTIDGLPVGLQLTGRWQADELLLTHALAVEKII